MLRKFLLCLFTAANGLTLPTVSAAAPREQPSVRVDWIVADPPQAGWTVGDRIQLRLSVTYPQDVQVSLPELPEAWGPFEVSEQRLLEPVDNHDGSLTAVREVSVVLWAPGKYETPPLVVPYRDASGTPWESLAPMATLVVVSVLEEGETEQRDLKPQIWLSSPVVWPWIFGGLLLAGLTGLAAWYLLLNGRWRRTPASFGSAVREAGTPHEIAYAELERVAALNLPALGELKRHYTLLADCLRSYIERRYGIPALDRTTEEVLSAFHEAGVDAGHAELMRALLSRADLVKFARFHPSCEQAQAALVQARHIVEVTRVAGEEMTDTQPGI